VDERTLPLLLVETLIEASDVCKVLPLLLSLLKENVVDPSLLFLFLQELLLVVSHLAITFESIIYANVHVWWTFKLFIRQVFLHDLVGLVENKVSLLEVGTVLRL